MENTVKGRFDSVNETYQPYVKKHLGENSLQNILTCGGSDGAVNVELERHKEFTYENIFHYEFKDREIHFDVVIKDNILYPKVPIESVNLIYADVGGPGCYDMIMKDDIKSGVLKILEAGLYQNKLGILVFLYFDGVGIEPFLNRQYGDYKSKDFFSKDVTWYDKYNKGTYSQRLDGVVFYK